MAEQYGFFTDEYQGGIEVETLQTGDGKALFQDISFEDGTVSIGMSYGPILSLKPVRKNRKQTVRNDPTRILAYKALRQAKRKGGNKIVIL